MSGVTDINSGCASMLSSLKFVVCGFDFNESTLKKRLNMVNMDQGEKKR